MSEWKPFQGKLRPPKKRAARLISPERRREELRGETKGVGCIVIVLGIGLTFFFAPLGIVLAIIGLAVLVFGFVR